MKRFSKFFLTGMLAMVLVFGLVLAGCKSDDGGGGGDAGGNLGTELKLEGKVYTADWTGEQPKYEIYAPTTPVTVTGRNGAGTTIGTGAISSSGDLTFNITSAPANANLIAVSGIMQSGSSGFLSTTHYNTAEFTPTGVQGLWLSLSTGTGSNQLFREGFSGSMTSATQDNIYFIYVAADVRIIAVGKDGVQSQGSTVNNGDVDLSLKQGWNAIRERKSVSGTTMTRTLSVTTSGVDLRWIRQ